MTLLEKYGHRIAVIGPSSSGKSTLALALGAALGTPVCHLDQLAHQPGTDWQRCPDSVFIPLHDAVAAREHWVIEGNYSLCMPVRFARATTVIWLDLPLALCLWRYLWRCVRRDDRRPGNLADAKGQFSLGLIRHTLLRYPRNRKKYLRLLQDAGVPVIRLRSQRALTAFYTTHGLSRP